MRENVFLREHNSIVVVNIYILIAVVCLVMIVYLCGFYYYQVIKGDYYRKKSESNRTRFEKIPAPRGIIYDSHDRVIADNRPSYNVFLVRENADINIVTSMLSQLCNVPESDMLDTLNKYKSVPDYVPVKILSDINQDCLARIEAYKFKIPWLFVSVQPVRSYPCGDVGSHIIGYLGEITQEELEKLGGYDYTPGDWMGKSGLEKIFETVLRGKNGMEAVEVDALGRRLGVLDKESPVAGRSIWLTLDWSLQQEAARLMEGVEGAVVALDPQSGAVRAMVSVPSYDPNVFIRGIKSDEWKKLQGDPRHIFLNRAIQVGYPPGSTFKPFIALAALESGVVNPNDEVWCPGYYRFGNRVYRCWKRGGHGRVDLHRAIVESCDVYFYQIGSRLGVDTIAQYAKLLGFGNVTGIELPGERLGLIPTSKWKLQHLGVPWQKGETLSVSIGQGFVLVTPLQLARAYGMVANGGISIKPYIVERIEGGISVKRTESTSAEDTHMNGKFFQIVKDALEDVVRNPRGTAHGIWNEKCPIAGKTGTAQVVRLEASGNNEKSIPKHLRDHAWFAGYAPHDNPKIVVVVIVEHGLHGSSTAAPIVKTLIEKYFELYPEEMECDRSQTR